jgi:glycosyltransferase involved in cell wall biosynthesis
VANSNLDMTARNVRGGQPRVLHILEAVGGGTLRHIVDLVQTVSGVEHHVVIPPDPSVAGVHASSADGEFVQEISKAGATIHRLPMVRNPLHPKNYLGILKLRKLLDEVRPVAVHGHSSVGGAFARAAAAGTKVPVVYTPHGLATHRSILWVEKLLAPLTHRFIAVSQSEGDRLCTLGISTEEKVVVIPNGVDLDPPEELPFDLRRELHLPADTNIVGTVARLVEQKAPLDYVKTCKEIHRSRGDVHFVLIGSGVLQHQVDAAVKSAGLRPFFHHIPFLSHAFHAIEQFNVFLLGSLFEGAPYTPLEAMRAGVPVVLSNVAGNRDTIEHDVSGLLFPFGDTSAMAQGVLNLLSNAQLRDSLSDAARIRLKEHFDVEEMGASLNAFYLSLLAGPRR